MTKPSKQVQGDRRCIFCQSPYHSYRDCPTIYKKRAAKRGMANAKQEYAGDAPNVFVGRYGYPNVNVGLLNVDAGSYDHHDDPLTWSREINKYPITKIVDLRSSMINARENANVNGVRMNNKYLDLVQEVSLTRTGKPAEVELALAKKPVFKLNFQGDAAPHGPSVALKRATLTSNPKLNHHVEKASADTDWKAVDAVQTLYRKGVDEHSLTKAFSVGNFGLARNRKLVPTRWSITAVDDTIGKRLIKEVKDYSESNCLAFAGGHHGNHYLILFLDDVWQYELFEQFVPQGAGARKSPEQIVIERDYEPYTGRTAYVHETAGGYYAARLGILEKLHTMKRQASVLAIRVITEEYTAPLGVWVVREAVRKALAEKPLTFEDRTLALEYARAYFKKRFGYDISGLLRTSKLVENLRSQTKLKKWI